MVHKKVKKKAKGNMVQSVLFIFMALLAVYILLRSPLFEIRNIVITGTQHLQKDTVLDAVGIRRGENIFNVKVKDAEQRLQLISLIQSAKVERKLPSTIDIQIAERVPVALLYAKDGFIQVDGEGIYLQKGSLDDKNLPILSGITCTATTPGKPVQGKELDAALQVVKQMPPELLPNLSEVNISEQNGVRLYTLDGVQCQLGPPLEVSEKCRLLVNILQELKAQGKKIEYVDMSYVGSPVVKYVD